MSRKISRGLRVILGLAGLLTLPFAWMLLQFSGMSVAESRDLSTAAILLAGSLGGGLFLWTAWRIARQGTAARRDLVAGALGAVTFFIGLSVLLGETKRTMEAQLLRLPRRNLLRLAEAQGAYHFQHGTYSADLSRLDSTLWRATSGIMSEVTYADSAEWHGAAVYERRSDLACTLMVRHDSIDGEIHFEDAPLERIPCNR